MIVLRNINRNNINDHVESICEALKTDNKLCLYRNDIDDECIRILCNILIDKKVKYIDLGKCPFTDEGSKMLYNLVCTNKTIEWIHPFDYPDSSIEGYDIYGQTEINREMSSFVDDTYS